MCIFRSFVPIESVSRDSTVKIEYPAEQIIPGILPLIKGSSWYGRHDMRQHSSPIQYFRSFRSHLVQVFPLGDNPDSYCTPALLQGDAGGHLAQASLELC